ncbi:RHS repeat-associated core domain-containing protein [Streptococcus cuniculi]|uniref:RHS repeat-associated core domain-containing protein n=1 Tax=Streptococcus cuniculi TaxID=1432788 RepID=A0A4Y9JBE0_9STRE|nr:RHS repeat-associated core domain-containing protein [Streptococcus cuniculi]MBF0778974.1 RHS repeat-associated core domain-containing protein [Streptococcus cuniculi]TFU97125.1 RHS repeat-associated core domain-containing protein [Streptococcus cuniculi]
MTYASEVKDVLIPYTTREYTYEYYEERNYVNDINRNHTEVLQSYDHDLKARETYSYGYGRNSYLNNQTGHDYQYLTNQSGSVTGLTKGGEAVASTSYNLYGATKTTTDETGHPYAYNGEARDVTGLDYLRARYYDSRAGTFLTEDSYQGELTNSLSQNRYAYVQNNPVNYTDPSGHSLVLTTMGGGRKSSSSASAFIAGIKRFASMIVAPIKTTAQFVSVTVRAAVATVQHTMMKAQPNHYTDAQKAKIRSDYASAVGAKAAFHIREAGNLALNWTKALADTMRHVCQSAGKATGGTTVHASTISFDSGQTTVAYDFKQNLMKQYGFESDEAELIWKLYQKVQQVDGKNADYIFNRLIGGIVYNDETPPKGFKKKMQWFKASVQWNGTAGVVDDPKSDDDRFAGISVQMRFNYKLSQSDYDRLSNVIKTQYKKSNDIDFQYSDFAHQSITTATHLYSNPLRLANLYGVLKGQGTNSHQYTNHLSGWLGDITLGKNPSINNPDYKADLDAVNIVALMKQNNSDYATASTQYYDGIASGRYNRADLFVKNNGGLSNIKQTVYDAVGIKAGSDGDALIQLRTKNPVAYNFIGHLARHKSDYSE